MGIYTLPVYETKEDIWLILINLTDTNHTIGISWKGSIFHAYWFGAVYFGFENVIHNDAIKDMIFYQLEISGL